MTKEEKELLLKDLCARLPYGVVCHIENDSDFEDLLQPYDGKVSFGLLDRFRGHQFDLKPYLRSMSSMTEEELKMFKQLQVEADEAGTFEGDMLLYDWLNKNHFDYRLLIFHGLAIEAPKGMYKTE